MAETSTSGFEQRVLQSIVAFSLSFDEKLGMLKEQLIVEQKAEMERLSKKIKLEKKFKEGKGRKATKWSITST